MIQYHIVVVMMIGETFMIKAYLEDISGATAIEYGLLAALISVSLIGSFKLFTGSVDVMFEKANDAMLGAN